MVLLVCDVTELLVFLLGTKLTLTLDDHSVMGLFFAQSFFGAIQPQGTTVLVLILVVLLFLSFVLAGSEVAFFSLTFKDINVLKSKQQPAYKRIVDLIEQPKILLASLLIANSFINRNGFPRNHGFVNGTFTIGYFSIYRNFVSGFYS